MTTTLLDRLDPIRGAAIVGRTEAELTAILEPLGYSWYRIDGPGPLEARARIEGDPSYSYMNWLFTPEEPSPAFWHNYAAWRDAFAPHLTDLLHRTWTAPG